LFPLNSVIELKQLPLLFFASGSGFQEMPICLTDRPSGKMPAKNRRWVERGANPSDAKAAVARKNPIMKRGVDNRAKTRQQSWTGRSVCLGILNPAGLGCLHIRPQA
jgi:hypothetical protein